MPKTVDFTDSVDPFAPIEEGNYHLKVAKATIKQAKEGSKHPGSDYLALEFNVVADENGDEKYKNRKVWLNVSMHNEPTVIGGLRRNLQILGENVPETGPFDVDEDNLVGRECMAVITIGENPKDKSPNNSVKRIMALDEETSMLP